MRRVLFVSTLVCVLVGAGLLPTAATAAPATPQAETSQAETSATAAGPPPSLAEAQDVVRRHGYLPIDTSGYDPIFDLSVIIGMLATSADGHPQQAFFFHRGQFVGTDAAEASAIVRWIWSTNDTVALQYELYRPDDPMCCPTGGAATVRFHWNGSDVVPLDPIPTNDWSAPVSRR